MIQHLTINSCTPSSTIQCHNLDLKDKRAVNAAASDSFAEYWKSHMPAPSCILLLSHAILNAFKKPVIDMGAYGQICAPSFEPLILMDTLPCVSRLDFHVAVISQPGCKN